MFAPLDDAFTIGLAGDLMFNSIPAKSRALDDVKKIVSTPDVFFANLEIPLTQAKTATLRKTPAELRARRQFVLKADPKHAEFIKKAGIDVVSLANNHGMDYGAAGSREMRKELDRVGLAHAGADDDAARAMRIATFMLPNGKKVGLFSALAFVGRGALLKTTPATANSPGVNVLNFNGKIDESAKARVARIVANAKRQCDVLVVGLHWGIERQTVPTDYQVSLGRAFAGAGADVVWGHHPHVLQGAEVFNGKPVFYSMGNFVSPTPAKTAIVVLRFEAGKLQRAFVQPCLIAGGKVSPLREVAAKNERMRFDELGIAIRRRFPNPDSKPLPTD